MSAVSVGNSRGRGRGVFARRRFAAGELIERAPVIVIPAQQIEFLDQTALYDYYFAWDPTPDDVAIALGYGSLYNHSYEPNAVTRKDFAERHIDFLACRPIEAEEEITINYN